MYRADENPKKLEQILQMLEYDRNNGTYIDDEQLIAIDEEIADIKERINFAYQDEEHDEC